MLAMGGAQRPRIRQFVRPEVVRDVLSDRDEDRFELRFRKIVPGVDTRASGSPQAAAVPYTAGKRPLLLYEPDFDVREPTPEVMLQPSRDLDQGIAAVHRNILALRPRTDLVDRRRGRGWDPPSVNAGADATTGTSARP